MQINKGKEYDEDEFDKVSPVILDCSENKYEG